MARGIRKRTWVKLDCQGVLHGSINWIFSLEERAVFLQMICMAAQYCKVPGIISDNEGLALPRAYMAQELHCPLEVLNSVIKKGSENHSIRETEDGCIELVNFPYYQFTEYDRQKPYRQEWKRRDRESDRSKPWDQQIPPGSFAAKRASIAKVGIDSEG